MTEEEPLTAEAISAALAPDALLGSQVRIYEVGVSAESLALAWARREEAPEGALVVAEIELSARGRRGVTWISAPGRSLSFAVVLRPGLPPAGEGLLWLLASLGAAEGVAAATGLDVSLKWPNDLQVGGRGIGAVRVDAQLGPGAIDSAVITVRLNTGLVAEDIPDGLRSEVTSIALEGAATPRTAVLASVLTHLEVHYSAGVTALLDRYRELCVTLGTRVRALLMPTGEAVGQAADIDEHGGLILETGSARGTIGVDGLRRLEPA